MCALQVLLCPLQCAVFLPISFVFPPICFLSVPSVPIIFLSVPHSFTSDPKTFASVLIFSVSLGLHLITFVCLSLSNRWRCLHICNGCVSVPSWPFRNYPGINSVIKFCVLQSCLFVTHPNDKECKVKSASVYASIRAVEVPFMMSVPLLGDTSFVPSTVRS
jgi:hypothetical protein